MSIKRTEFEENKDHMCKGCMLFFGSQAHQGLCSSCYKKKQSEKKEEIVSIVSQPQKISLAPCRKDTTDTLEQIVQKPAQKDKMRCFNCNKKLGLLGLECKCGFIFCNAHRLPEEHKCDFDFKVQGRKKLEKQIIKVYNGKIADI